MDFREGFEVFHVYNRSNDRRPVFHDDENYQFFLSKLVRQMKGVAEIIGYCCMPNHFHLLLLPLHKVIRDLTADEKGMLKVFPTQEMGEAIRRLEMGYTKSYNLHFGQTGSRWRQHARVKSHGQSIRNGLNYIHMNPVEGGLVNHPAEWGFSSYNEYSGLIKPDDCIINFDLGQRLLKNDS